MNSAAETVREINELLAGDTRAAEEQKLLALLRSLEGDGFAAGLSQINLSRPLSALDWRAWGPDFRDQFLRLLKERSGLLELEMKAHLINLLAEGRTSSGEEKVIAALFLSETGQRLTDLKLRIDTSAEGHDLLGTLSGDIDSAELRAAVSEHFRRSALLPEDPRQRLVRVVSDIDDTLYSSLNDPRYPKGTLYKGVLELFAGVSDLPPVFLAARPELVTAHVRAAYAQAAAQIRSGQSHARSMSFWPRTRALPKRPPISRIFSPRVKPCQDRSRRSFSSLRPPQPLSTARRRLRNDRGWP